jgi:hypothetical protein
MKKLYKKLILVMNLYGLSFVEKLEKMFGIQKAHTDHPTYVPGLDPTPADVATKIDDAKKLLAEETDLKEKLKANTQKQLDAETELTNIFVSRWIPQTQTADDMTIARAKELGYGIKGEKEVKPPSAESFPLIAEVVTTAHGQHTIFCHDNLTKKIKLPDGILRIDIYGQTGGTRPENLEKLIANGGGWLGQVTRGKYEHKYGANGIGSVEYYIAVYIDKATKKPFSCGPTYGALLN